MRNFVALRKESVDRNRVIHMQKIPNLTSLSARRAWIEIKRQTYHKYENLSLSARRAWIEIVVGRAQGRWQPESLSARRAWIEIVAWLDYSEELLVALRKESVDRNCQSCCSCPDC